MRLQCLNLKSWNNHRSIQNEFRGCCYLEAMNYEVLFCECVYFIGQYHQELARGFHSLIHDRAHESGTISMPLLNARILGSRKQP